MIWCLKLSIVQTRFATILATKRCVRLLDSPIARLERGQRKIPTGHGLERHLRCLVDDPCHLFFLRFGHYSVQNTIPYV